MSKQVIWKYPVPVEDSFEVDLPKGAQILHVGAQGVMYFMWCLITHPATSVEVRRFRVFDTGQLIPDDEDLTHVATWQQAGFVWHLFEKNTHRH